MECPPCPMSKALGTPSTLIPYSVSSRRDRFQIIIILPFTFVSHDIFNVKRINIYYKSIRPFGVYGHGLQFSPSYRGRQVTAPSNAKQDNFTRRANYMRHHCHLKTNRPIFGIVGLQSFRGSSESLQL